MPVEEARRPKSPIPPVVRLPPVFLLLALEACSPVYVYKSWRGNENLLSKQRPIVKVLSDPDTPPEEAARLKLTPEILAFASDVMGMPKTKSYSTYVKLNRPYVTYVVTACPKTSLEPYEWWFPFIGHVPYKGYFDIEDARKEQSRLKDKGYDTLMGGVSAYSTLGWIRDPILSTMLGDSVGEFAETLLHEMTHAYIYFNDDADFNESMATFVGQQSAADFLERRFGKDSPELKGWNDEMRESQESDAAWKAVYKELSDLYDSPLSEAEKLAKREEIFARVKEDQDVKTVNNAVVRAHHRYHDELEDFQQAYERLGRDWPKMLALLKSLDRRDPRAALQAWLSSNPKPKV